MASRTVEAIKAEALAAVRSSAAKYTGSVAIPTPAKVEAKKAPIEWPVVLKNDGRLFSEAFGDLLPKTFKYKDFYIPSYDGYAYPEWMAAYIPAESDYQSDPALLYDAVLAYACGSVTHLVGPPGTGKTNGIPVLVAARLGLPLLRLGLNKKGMMLEDLIGREAILSGAEGVHTGHRDGMLIPWVQHPCIILADEFCRTNVEISNGLMSLMERNGCLIVENRATPVIARHEHCWILASDNVKGLGDRAAQMIGTDVMDGAILDRFEITLEVDYLPADAQMKLVESWFPGFPAEYAEKLVKFGSLIQESYKKDILPLSFSPRTLKECARYSCLHNNCKDAVRKVVMSKYAEESDISAIKEMYRTAFADTL